MLFYLIELQNLVLLSTMLMRSGEGVLQHTWNIHFFLLWFEEKSLPHNPEDVLLEAGHAVGQAVC